ncbi:hypothetical protein AAMO2058_001070100 [Amorphochlora amoebiformis]
MEFKIVVAAEESTMGIGKGGKLPWRLPGDMKFFRHITTSVPSGSKLMNAVVMGRKTWESIPEKFRPLPQRLNVVVTRNSSIFSNDGKAKKKVLVAPSFEGALDILSVFQSHTSSIHSVFVIGGASIYKQAVSSSYMKGMYITKVDPCGEDLNCDVFFPKINLSGLTSKTIRSRTRENGIEYEIVECSPPESGMGDENKDPNSSGLVYTSPKPAANTGSRNLEELQYLKLIRDILGNGVKKGDRTGTGTISKFGCTMRFNLRERFPLLTTKRVFWKGVAQELLWFIKGCTNAKTLTDKGVKIWKANGSREYLDRIGLTHREENDLGPVYGFQWRHFGAEYKDMHSDYSNQGVDQLKQVIEKIKNKPTDRRIIMSAWNPADLKKMALPPCHMFCQFYVANGELSCQMYQRSCDMGLGVPFNIASYSLLTCMIAQVCGLKPGDFVHVMGDTHVYLNHIEPLKRQLEREPRQFPTLWMNPEVKDIDKFKYTDFKIKDYKPYPTIKMKMAV